MKKLMEQMAEELSAAFEKSGYADDRTPPVYRNQR